MRERKYPSSMAAVGVVVLYLMLAAGPLEDSAFRAFAQIRTTGSQATQVANPQGVAHPAQSVNQITNGIIGPAKQPPLPPLKGWVDLHAHLMGHLGFGGKLLYGGPDASPAGGSWLPADPVCLHNVRAVSEVHALGEDGSTHGGWGAFDNKCGNDIRKALIHALQQGLGGDGPPANDPPDAAFGYPTFVDWPKWNDLTHQRMWVDWIHRAWQGGLRVMVALAVNNKTLGDFVLAGNQPPPVGSTWQSLQGQNSDLPTDDKTSADIQINEIKSFVARHLDFMEVALSSADVYRIVSANKIAVVIGMEVDHIGNFGQVFYSKGLLTDPGEWQADWAAASVPPSDAAVRAEIDRLYGEGVRYLFPIHLLDNAFGGTAAYVELFNISTLRESGHIWNLTCNNAPGDNIKWTYNNNSTSFTSITVPLVNYNVKFSQAVGISYPSCSGGNKNALGLTPAGISAVNEMMRLGMLIDIDHMSELSQDEALYLACFGQLFSNTASSPFTSPYLWSKITAATASSCPFGYPLNTGHSGPRGAFPDKVSERSMRPDQYAMIGYLHGMAGVGSANLSADKWLWLYQNVINDMGGDPLFTNPYNPASALYNPRSPVTQGRANPNGIVAGFGADFNGLEFAMPPRAGSRVSGFYGSTIPIGGVPQVFAMPSDPGVGKTWNYDTDGVAHYGMLWDFLQDVRTLDDTGTGKAPGSGATMVDTNFMYGADYFYRTWQIAEQQAKCVAPFSGYSGINCNQVIPNQPPPPPSLLVKVTPIIPRGYPFQDTVSVTFAGRPVAGATVSVTGQPTYTAITNPSGLAVISHLPCYAPGSQVPQVGGTSVPIRTPAPCAATVSKTGFLTTATMLP